MLLNRLTTQGSHVRADTALNLLTTFGLPGELQSFLLSCQVDSLSPTTVKGYNWVLAKFVAFCQGQGVGSAKDVTRQHVRLFLLSLQATNKPVSVMVYYKALKRFFNWLVTEHIIPESPMKEGFHPPKVGQYVIMPFSDQELQSMLELCAVDTFLAIRNRAIVLVFLDNGVRLKEMAGIQLSDVDFDRGTIKVLGKGGKERQVPIGKQAQKALLRYLYARRTIAYSPLWLTEEKRPLSAMGLQSAIEILCKRAGVNGAKPGPHTFRHTFAIKFLRNGGSEFTLQMILGHSTLSMTRKYVSSLGLEDALKVHHIASPVDNLFRT